MGRKIIVLTIFLLLVLVSIPALAEEIEVKAYVSQTQVRLGQSVTLNVEIIGNTSVPGPQVVIANCRVQSYGSSTQVTITNGKSSQLVKYTYSLVPTKTGTIEVPALEVKWRGKSYYSQPIQLTVTEGSTDAEKSLEEQMRNYVFLKVEVPKTQLYVNELLPLTIKLYVQQSIDLKNIHYPEVNFSNVLHEPFPRPAENVELRDGLYFRVYSFKTTIQPIARGKHHLGPITLQADLPIPRQNNRHNSLFSSFFEPNYDLVPLNFAAEDLVLEVLNLPSEGMPLNFTGAIGRFNMEVSVTPQQVKIGEPITIRSKITGQGNFNTVTGPVIAKTPQFKYYDSQMVSSNNQKSQPTQEKIYEQVIIPLEQIPELPEISFSYFDPELKRYQTISQKSLPVQVLEENFTAQMTDYRQGPVGEQVLGEDILYIKGNVGALATVGQVVSPIYQLYNAVLLCILISGLSLRWWLNRESPLLKSRKEATIHAKKILGEIENLLNSGQSVEFYNKLYQTIQNYLKEYYQITVTGISEYETEHLLKARVSEELIAKIKEFYAEIDQKRFAGYYSTQSEMERILNQAKEIVTQISKGEVVG